jgi:hypothetical protein
MTNYFKNVSLAAALIAAPMAVAAAPITIDYAGPQLRADVDLSDSEGILAGLNANQPAGGFGVTDGTNTFTAWCVELTETLRLPREYDNEGTPATISAAITENLSRLFTGFANKIVTNLDSAAFQVAIWEIVYDDGLDLGSGDFQMSDTAGDAGVQAIANGYLTEMSKYQMSYDMSYFTADGSQDLVTGDPNGGSLEPVPLPATGLLLIAGLGALGMAGRRKRA